MKSFEKYAEYYDLIYQDKDYEAECDFLEEIFRKYSINPVKTILDAGCGSGRHTVPMAKRGYDMEGFDLSEVMLKRAKKYAKNENITNLDLHVMDLCNFQINKKFDTCICMFAVMGYLTKTHDILKTLSNIRKHLKDNSLFTFDFWNGLAVLRILPSDRAKIMEDGRRRVIRIVEPELDALNHICKVHYRLVIIENDRIVDEVEETHVVRFYFPQEMTHYLEDAGFEVLKVCPFLDLNGKVDENDWNIAVIAKAVGGEE